MVSKPEPEAADSAEEGVELSPDLEREICLAVNRELHVSYCYLVMGGIFTRQGLKSFSGMCERQEDTHRGVARELVAHVVSRGGRLRLADIAEPGPACGAQVSCAEAVRVGLRLEQWLLETFSIAQEVATKVHSNPSLFVSILTSVLNIGGRHCCRLSLRLAGQTNGGGGGRRDARVQGPLQFLAGQEILAGNH